ncbi:MAG: cache domain-containing protein [Campylobacterales bacterium]|nr:cache domain-containing protein [Campylobacterales bacterium]
MKNQDAKLIRFVTYIPFFFIPTIIVLIFYLIVSTNEHQFEQSLEQLQTSIIQTQKNITLSKVKSVINLIEYKRSMAREILKEKVKNRVDAAYSIASNIYFENRDKKSHEEIQKMIIDSLRPLTWNGGESFIFILDFNGIFHLAPSYLRDKEGKSIIDFQDATGRYVIREEIALAKTKGEGYLWDTFTRPRYDKTKQFKQLAFVKKFNVFNWYIGSAEYLDTRQNEIDKHLLDIIDHLATDDSSYIFVLDSNGTMIRNIQNKELEGSNILDLKDKDGKMFIQEIIQQAKLTNLGFISYYWKNPKNGLIDKKYSYIQKVDGKDWIIGSGYYQGDLDKQIQLKKDDLSRIYQKQFKVTFIISFLLTIVGLLGSYQLSKLLQQRFKRYTLTIRQKTIELRKINHSLEETVKARTLELQKAYHNMETLAMTDSLTGIANRYAFDKTLSDEIHRANRNDTSLSLMIFDLDYFKKINDTYGHATGDIILQGMTNRVVSMLREEDFFARYGGEEFIIILPYTEIQNAAIIAERIRTSIEAHIFDTDKRITVSIGISSYHKNEESYELLQRADEALYDAKNNGRNQTILKP